MSFQTDIVDPLPEQGPLTKWASQLVGTPWFQHSITAVILIAGIMVGIETDEAWALHFAELFMLADIAILAIFTFEIAVKMLALWPKPMAFFKDPWNVFDFTIVAVAFLPFLSSYALLLRLFRLFRVLRLIRTLPRLQRLVGGLLYSLPSMAYVLLLLLLLFYVYGCAGVFLFGDLAPEYFGSLPRSLWALFQLVTLEDWPDLIAPLMADAAPAAVLYFVSFIMLGTMVMLNLLIGVILEGMQSSAIEISAERKSAREKSADRAIPQSGEGELHRLELEIKDLKRLLFEVHQNLGLGNRSQIDNERESDFAERQESLSKT